MISERQHQLRAVRHDHHRQRFGTVLKDFYSNSIVSPDSADQLFSLMETQVYREGIPAGIGSDGVVQDKVGFMDGLLHDAAIVRSDKATTRWSL